MMNVIEGIKAFFTMHKAIAITTSALVLGAAVGVPTAVAVNNNNNQQTETSTESSPTNEKETKTERPADKIETKDSAKVDQTSAVTDASGQTTSDQTVAADGTQVDSATSGATTSDTAKSGKKSSGKASSGKSSSNSSGTTKSSSKAASNTDPNKMPPITAEERASSEAHSAAILNGKKVSGTATPASQKSYSKNGIQEPGEPGHMETVVAAYDEAVVDKPAWDEQVEAGEKVKFDDGTEWDLGNSQVSNEMMDKIYAKADETGDGYFNVVPYYNIVHHDVVTHTVHHDAVTRWVEDY